MIADVAAFANRWHLRLGAVWLAVGLGLLVIDWVIAHQRPRSDLGVMAIPLTSAMALVGLWATVPDTEAPLMAAVALCPVLLARAGRRRSVRPAESVVVLAAYAAATAVGSAGRMAAIAGAVCCASVPVALVVSGERGRRVHPGMAVAIEFVACLIGSRVLGQL